MQYCLKFVEDIKVVCDKVKSVCVCLRNGPYVCL